VDGKSLRNSDMLYTENQRSEAQEKFERGICYKGGRGKRTSVVGDEKDKGKPPPRIN